MFNFAKLVSPRYLFYVDTIMMTRSDKLFPLLGATALALAIVLKIAAVTALSPVDRKYRSQMFDLLLTVGVWELVWYGFRYEEINFFGSHFVALLGLLIGLVWLAVLGKRMLRHYTSEKQVWEKEQVKLRYLPK